MCDHIWDPEKTYKVYYWDELLPPLIIYRWTMTLAGAKGRSTIHFILTYALGEQAHPKLCPHAFSPVPDYKVRTT